MGTQAIIPIALPIISFIAGYLLAIKTIKRTQGETAHKIVQLISAELGVIVEEEKPKAEKKDLDSVGYLR